MWFVILSILAVLLAVLFIFTDLPISPVNLFLFLLAYIFCCFLELYSIVAKRKFDKNRKK